ncbi:unnamed protein product [Plutella xylostella]|uniref:NADH dehydrogenase [ubiquinone] 1 alpha subcomplex subunit 6 n=1 Tax=Plutella xylostella TaxID=51655 RepID=A0A8S4DRC6_PLUXY|nr:unnamed protein product [Plutella xylostella]
MSAKQAIQVGSRYVKPMLSLSKVKDFDMPKTEEQCRDKLKEIFLKNKDVSDIRVIDVLVIKGQMELQECVKIWKQKGHVMAYWKPSEEPKPKDFLSKFFAVLYCDINKSHQQCRDKLREKFYKNACVTDTRVVDMLVIKGYMELKEVTHNWMQKGRIMAHWNPTHEPKPKEFIAKFLRGLD